MKKYATIIIIAVCSLLSVQAETELEVKSVLKKVIVFPFQAQLFNTADVQLPGNTVLLAFTNLSANINPKSICVVGDDNMNILNVSFKKDFLSKKVKDGKREELLKKLNDLQEKQKDINVLYNIENDYNSYLNIHKTFSREFVTTPQKFEDLCNYFSDKKKQIQENMSLYNRQIRILGDSIRIYQNEINKINNSQDEPTGTVLVLVNSPESRKVSMEVSYTVNNVSWSPSYNLSFESVNKPLLLNYKANILQQSGIDWSEVNLTLSNAQTQKFSDIPILHPLFLGYVYREQNTSPIMTANTNQSQPVRNSVRRSNYSGYGRDPNVTATQGVVKDERGETVIGAAVRLKGTDIGTITDINGWFSINQIPQGGGTLLITYIGMQDLEVPIYSSNMDITMNEKTKDLDAVMVVGYGQTKKRDLVASVSSESSYEERQVQADGSPDANMKIRVRGGGSLTQNSGPLYILNGTPVSDISNISPTDIKSVEVLKEESASAIYGAQGAHGVILVTTKDATDKVQEKNDTLLQNYKLDFSAKKKKPITTTFDVEETQSVKSGVSTQVPFKHDEVPCIFEYKSIPKLSEKVYLVAHIPNWNDLDLQTADANLYFENAFIGTTKINTSSLNDTLIVSFGADQGISVKREKIKDFTENVSLSSKRLQTLSWRILVKNNKNEDVKVTVFDQIPLNKQDNFSVKELELSGGELDKSTGEVKWNVAIPAGGSKELVLTIQVKYPKGTRVILN